MTRTSLITACLIAGCLMALMVTPAAADPDPWFQTDERTREEARETAKKAREMAAEARRQARTAAAEARRSGANVVIRSRGTSYLGVGVAEIDAERAKTLKLSEVRGVEIKSIEDGSAAEKAGLREGDVVLEYNGQRVEGVEQFQRYVRETPPGREVRLAISRDGVPSTVTATLGTRRGLVARTWDGSEMDVPIPPIPPIVGMAPMRIEIPDMPRGALSWRNTVLGVETESLGPQLASFFGVKEGVLVRSVSKDSPAERAGIRAGDVIIRVGDTNVSTPREMSTALRDAREKRSVAVVLVRSQKEMTVTVEIATGGPANNIIIGEPTGVLLRTRV